MTTLNRLDLAVPEGFRSRETALFLAQMDDQSRRLGEATRGLGAAALAWQPAPGINTIGMLLAHIAAWEVFWTRVALERSPTPEAVQDALGISMADVGTPLPADGRPPAALAGRPLEFFDDLLARARAHLLARAAGVGDDDLGRPVRRTRFDGTQVDITPRWALYHMLEHEAQHIGQILLLKRLVPASPPSAGGV